jgi:hypothetical protein
MATPVVSEEQVNSKLLAVPALIVVNPMLDGS